MKTIRLNIVDAEGQHQLLRVEVTPEQEVELNKRLAELEASGCVISEALSRSLAEGKPS